MVRVDRPAGFRELQSLRRRLFPTVELPLLADSRDLIKQPVPDQVWIFTANRAGSGFTRRTTAGGLATQAQLPTTKRSPACRWR